MPQIDPVATQFLFTEMRARPVQPLQQQWPVQRQLSLHKHSVGRSKRGKIHWYLQPLYERSYLYKLFQLTLLGPSSALNLTPAPEIPARYMKLYEMPAPSSRRACVTISCAV